MRHFLTACALAMAPAIPADADELRGTFRTESGKTGGVLHVVFEACDEDPEKICGVIESAYDRTDTVREDFPHLGKPVIWGMEHAGSGRYTGGQLWQPEAGKVLRAELLHRGDILRVSGCVGPICRSEVWVRQD